MKIDGERERRGHTIANPSIEAVGDGEMKVRIEPCALDENWFGWSCGDFKLQARVPGCCCICFH